MAAFFCPMSLTAAVATAPLPARKRPATVRKMRQQPELPRLHAAPAALIPPNHWRQADLRVSTRSFERLNLRRLHAPRSIASRAALGELPP